MLSEHKTFWILFTYFKSITTQITVFIMGNKNMTTMRQ